MKLGAYLSSFSTHFPHAGDSLPWNIVSQLDQHLNLLMTRLSDEFTIQDGRAIHKTAIIEEGVVLKGMMIIGPHVFVGAHAYLRGGVYLADHVRVGPGCEVKTSVVLEGSALAHFNFVGDSLIGSRVNFEAGSILANHYNERTDKQIHVLVDGNVLATGVTKFGALVGDDSRIGANAVCSPGTILPPGTVVNRLQLIQQLP